VVGTAGEVWRVRCDGRLEPIRPGGYPSELSSEPIATRRAP
jgi:hypothetical protein